MAHKHVRAAVAAAAVLSLGAGVLPAAVALADQHTPRAQAPPGIRYEPGTGQVRVAFQPGGLTGPSSEAASDVVLAYLRANRAALGLSATQLNQLAVSSSYRTRHNGAQHLTLAQAIDGMRVYERQLTATVDRQGRLVLVGGRLASGATAGAGTLTAQQALDRAAAAQGARARGPVRGADRRIPSRQKFENVYAVPGLAHPAPLVVEPVWYEPGRGQALRPAYATDIEVSSHNWYESVVDARTGAVLERRTRYQHSGPEGTVFREEHPDVTGATRQVTPFSGLDGSWVADRTTSGNNVNAYRDLNDDDLNNEQQPTTPASGDPGHQHFTYAFTDDWRNDADGDQESLDADVDAITTQLFYYTNVLHDYLYGLGFDEVARNFQVDNFGRGGSGNDPVLAEAQDGWDNGCENNATPPQAIRCRNNANFGTPGDGSSPRMQMYMWTPGFAWRDGSLDGDVIAHEYGHGVSNRLVGGGSLGSGAQTGALGEGWSDAISLLKWNDNRVGEYATGNATRGIRSTAYDTSTEGYGSFDPARGVHRNGEVWAATMYDIREAKGIGYTQQLVIDGMKNTVSSPDYLDARDGILAADQTNTGGANQCLLWRIFADRGMGNDASSSADQNTETAGSGVPAGCRPTAEAGGPYNTPEGTDVTLSASGSARRSEASAGAITSYAWDFDADGQYDDATGAAPAFTAVGQDRVVTVGLQVTDSNGITATDTATMTVTNVAPSVTVTGGTASENTTVTVTATVSDPGWQDSLTATVDWGDGVARPLSGTLENVRPNATLGLTATHTYGDDGAFTVTICGRDDDTSTCRTGTATITNTRPTAGIGSSGQTTFLGTQAFVAHAGQPVAVTGTSTDPGSDDLSLSWAWGDGETTSRTSLVNPPALDPDPSPSIQPRNLSLTESHAYASACLFDLRFTAADDDAGSAFADAVVVVAGNASRARSQGYWKAQYDTKPPNEFSNAQLLCYARIVSALSPTYDGLTIASVDQVLSSTSSQPKALLSRQMLAAWLNFANGSYDLGTPVDTNRDGVLDSTFGAAVAAAEGTYLRSGATSSELLEQKDVMEALNLRDGG